MSAPGWKELDESAHLALTRFHNRTGWENGKQVPITFFEALESESDGEEAAAAVRDLETGEELEPAVPLPIGDYERRFLMAGARAFARFIIQDGVHPIDMLKQLADACRTMHIAPFHQMTMEEQAMLLGQGRAAVSFRGKVLSREIRLSGMKADKIPGQKSKAASESYRQVRHQQQRLKLNGQAKPKARQKSFLRQLHVAPRPSRKAPARQGSGGHGAHAKNGENAKGPAFAKAMARQANGEHQQEKKTT